MTRAVSQAGGLEASGQDGPAGGEHIWMELSSSAYIYHCIGHHFLEQSVTHMFRALWCLLDQVISTWAAR